MLRKILQYGFLTSLGLSLFLVSPMAHAYLEDTGSSYDPFKLQLKDLERHIEKLDIKTENNSGILDDSIFNRDGEYIVLDFKYYDSNNDETYVIPINYNTQNQPYGLDYIIGDTSKLIILPSKIKIKDSNLEFSSIESDTMEFDVKYLNSISNASGSQHNRIRTAPYIKKHSGGYSTFDGEGGYDTNEYEIPKWDSEDITLDIDLEIEIPLKLRAPSLRGENGVLANSASTPGKPIVDSVTASISVNNGKIKFNPGWDKVEQINNQIIAEEQATQKELAENKKRAPLKEIEKGFSAGEGIQILISDMYKGISSETDLEQFLIGITNFVLTFVSVIAVIMLIYGGFLWITDQGDDQQSEKARKVIAGAIIGILIIISAYTIVNTVVELEGETCSVGFVGTGMQADCTFEGNAATTAGIGSLVGGVLGGNDGSMVGGLIGGLLGGG